jgi:8-oxo-dGTP pyrophosphatase MutT (NUDIX family)
MIRSVPSFHATTTVDVTDAEGFLLGTSVPYVDALGRGLWHRLVAIHVTDGERAFLARRRVRDALRGKLDAPLTGIVLTDEDPHTAARRLVLETLGIEGTPRLLHSQSYDHPPVEGMRRREVVFTYAIRLPPYAATPDRDPAGEPFVVIPLEQLCDGVLAIPDELTQEEIDFLVALGRRLRDA